MQELKANPDRSAKGTVIEAGLDKAKGPFATFIVQNGTLKRGDVLVCGEAFGKVGTAFCLYICYYVAQIIVKLFCVRLIMLLFLVIVVDVDHF